MDRWILIAVLFIAGLFQISGELQADFHMQNIKGKAVLTWRDSNTLIVNLAMESNMGPTDVEIHPIWVNHDGVDICSTKRIGEVVEGLSKRTNISAGDVIVEYSNVDLPNLEYLDGYSLALRYDSDKTVCATIRKTADTNYETAEVVFRGTIFGHIHLRQGLYSSAKTRIVTDLATRTVATMGDWRISDSFQSCQDFMTNVLANIYDPVDTKESGNCNKDNHRACAVGDLSSKHGHLYFSGRIGDLVGRRAYSDDNLPLSPAHSNSVAGLLMIIIPKDEDVKPACGVINVIEARSATATFSESGVQGTIKFTQKSPLDPTQTVVDLVGLNAKAGGYHVHLWPTPERLSATEGGMCGNDRVSGHFNPFEEQVGIPSDPSYPNAAESTNDLYEVGDLSGKYGTLQGKQAINDTYEDWNLQLFGTNSIVGRSLVIHRFDETASRWMCVNIEPNYPVLAAEAVFTYPVIGRVMFMQAKDRPDSDTSVFVSLDYIDDRQDTHGHAWMVGSAFTGPDMLEEDVTKRCLSAGSTYNPDNLWPLFNTRMYSDICSQNRPVACKTGDLSGKMGLLGIGNSAGSGDRAKKWFATATSLPLAGPRSVLGKPLVIRNVENTASLACATVTPVHPVVLEAKLTSGRVTGTVRFSQNVGFGSRQTTVDATLDGMTDSDRLMIYELPPMEGQSDCSGLGEVFDPLNVGDAALQSTGATDDKFRVGDLSTYSGTSLVRYNLPLFGPNSVKGRSVVVDHPVTSPKSCAVIELASPGWTRLQAVANFSGEVTGTILMYQDVHPDGAMSGTTIITDLEHSDPTKKSQDHNWHTHVKPVSGDSDASSGRCMSTGLHYNPFRADISLASYSTECSPINQLRCELGDQSKKTKTIGLGEGRKLHTDTYQPLVGRFTVQGRSIVVHAENKGAPRVACADIIPQTSNPVSVTFKTPASFARLSVGERLERVTKVYADAIRANPGEVIVVSDEYSQEETTVAIHFVGSRGTLLRTRFLEYISDENRRDKLGQFVPFINSAGPGQISISFIMFTLIPSVVFSRMVLQ